ncbi:MAG: hypothetical protein Q8O26_04600 [Phreatobacter sp.]|nr:hypothetical protein [Phreatobacter sp.]MDP2801145.1 hypothetical protein [Phreatobacter sp.]
MPSTSSRDGATADVRAESGTAVDDDGGTCPADAGAGRADVSTRATGTA